MIFIHLLLFFCLGYLWEQYHALDGAGRKSHPFTGWTALITAIMAESY
jgi:mannosyl-oligosaccharide glucosidase